MVLHTHGITRATAIVTISLESALQEEGLARLPEASLAEKNFGDLVATLQLLQVPVGILTKHEGTPGYQRLKPRALMSRTMLYHSTHACLCSPHA